MKFEDIKKWHLLLSSVLYFLVVIIALLRLIGDYFYSTIMPFISVILFIIGSLSLIYYVYKKEELMSKVLSISNIILSAVYITIFRLYADIYYYFRVYENFYYGFFSYHEYISISNVAIIAVSLIFLIFNWYLYSSRELH